MLIIIYRPLRKYRGRRSREMGCLPHMPTYGACGPKSDVALLLEFLSRKWLGMQRSKTRVVHTFETSAEEKRFQASALPLSIEDRLLFIHSFGGR
jgi:hypothetical protein